MPNDRLAAGSIHARDRVIPRAASGALVAAPGWRPVGLPAAIDRRRALAGLVARWVAIFVAMLAFALAFRHTYIDDAYITLQYARSLAWHGTWGFYPDHVANTATSPLNVALLALMDRLTPGPTVGAVAWLTAAEWTALLAVLLRLSYRLTGRPFFGLLAFAGLITNPLLLSTIGMESFLFAVLTLLAVWLFVEGRSVSLGVALALLTLTRPDGVLLLLAMLLLLPAAGWHGRWQVGLAFAATALPWYLFSWIWLGSVVPDTLLIKLHQTAWGATTFADGFALYRDHFPAATAVSLWPVLFLPFALVPIWRAGSSGRRAIGALVAATGLHAAGYAAMGVPPFHWYFAPEVTALTVVGTLGASTLIHAQADSLARANRWPALAATALPAVGLLVLGPHAGWTPRVAPFTTNWATPGQYQALGESLRGLIGPEDVVELRGEIGSVAYYCDCRLVDVFVDQDRTTTEVDDLRGHTDGLLGALLDLNFAWRADEPDLPAPRYLLNFVPYPPGTAPPEPPAAVASWDVSSVWVPATRITLSATAYLQIDIRADGPQGQPALSGEYDVVAVAAGPNAPHTGGTWSGDTTDAIPVTPNSTIHVVVRAPGYAPFAATVAVATGTTRITAFLSADDGSTPRAVQEGKL